MIKLEFLKFESKSDWIQIWNLHMSRYLDSNFQLNFWIEVIPTELKSQYKIIKIIVK